jgi:hypothetical protein
MKNFLTVAFLLFAVNASACMSDYNCPYGQKCVKAPYQYHGSCMEVVNRYGQRSFDYRPNGDIDSGQAECRFDTDCDIGFRCDRYYKKCFKR